jgi:hypothetical protein
MTLVFRTAHRVVTSLVEPRVAHLTFANEDGMERFLRDNKESIKTTQIHRKDWNHDFCPTLTITAA